MIVLDITVGYSTFVEKLNKDEFFKRYGGHRCFWRNFDGLYAYNIESSAIIPKDELELEIEELAYEKE